MGLVGFFLVVTIVTCYSITSTIGARCNEAIFVGCDCWKSDLHGLILSCDKIPKVRKQNMESLQTVRILIQKEKKMKEMNYNVNIWPRLSSIEDENQKMLCYQGKCLFALTTKISPLTTNYDTTQWRMTASIPTVRYGTTNHFETEQWEKETEQWTLTKETLYETVTSETLYVTTEYETLTKQGGEQNSSNHSNMDLPVKIDSQISKDKQISSKEITFIATLTVSILINITLSITLFIINCKKRLLQYNAANVEEIEMENV